MLYVNKEQVTADELAKMFNVPIAKIRKAPVFEVNPRRKKKDILNGGYITPLGTRVPTFFFADLNGTKREIRYAETASDELVGERLVTKYHPAKVTFLGAQHLVADIEEAVYIYLHPLNETSPFRGSLREEWHWSFVDDSARAQVVIDKYQEVTAALNYINSLSGDHLRTVAKGLGFQSVATIDDDKVLHSMLLGMATANDGKDAGKFNVRVRDNQTLFTGIIRNAVDNGVFELKEVFQSQKWVWAAGPQKGQTVVEVMSNTAGSPEQVLIDHVNGHINDYYSLLMDLQTQAVANNVSKSFLDNVKMDPAAIFNGPARSQEMEWNRKAPDEVRDEYIAGVRERTPRDYEREAMQSPTPMYYGKALTEEEKSELSEYRRFQLQKQQAEAQVQYPIQQPAIYDEKGNFYNPEGGLTSNDFVPVSNPVQKTVNAETEYRPSENKPVGEVGGSTEWQAAPKEAPAKDQKTEKIPDFLKPSKAPASKPKRN